MHCTFLLVVSIGNHSFLELQEEKGLLKESKPGLNNFLVAVYQLMEAFVSLPWESSL